MEWNYVYEYKRMHKLMIVYNNAMQWYNISLLLYLDQLSGIFIKSIIEGSTAESDGRLKVNDQIIEVSTEWMDEWKWMNGWMDRWMDEKTDMHVQWIDDYMNTTRLIND